MGDQLQTLLQSPFPSPHATFLVLAWQASVRDLFQYSCHETFLISPSVRTDRTPVNLTHTLFDVCSQALDCTSALHRVCRLHTLHLLMATRQTSIITTTAPPAPAPAMSVEIESVVYTIPVVVFSTRFEQHPSTITSSLALDDCKLVHAA